MLMKSCRDCGRLIPYGQARCADCQTRHEAERSAREKEKRREYNRRYNAKRDPKYKRFYHSKEWKTLSAKVMQTHGYRCDWCGKRVGQLLDDGRMVTLEVDHIEPVQSEAGWSKRFEESNLRVLCLDCHNVRHGRFRGRQTPGGGSKSLGRREGTREEARSVEKTP